MEVNQNFNSFLGTGWAFPPAFDSETGSVEMVSNMKDINESLQILLSTSLGERVMQPRYGCDLHDYLFEPLSSSVIGYIKDRVKNSILLFEPRIIAEKIEVTADDSFDLTGYGGVSISHNSTHHDPPLHSALHNIAINTQYSFLLNAEYHPAMAWSNPSETEVVTIRD